MWFKVFVGELSFWYCFFVVFVGGFLFVVFRVLVGVLSFVVVVGKMLVLSWFLREFEGKWRYYG